MYLSIVIPAYNEAKRIGPTLQSVGKWLATQSFSSEVIVVDNHSTDETAETVRHWMSARQGHSDGHTFPIRLISEKRPGKGYAVRAGMLFAGGQVRLFMDADNATTVDHFEKVKPFLDRGYDVVIGSIAVPGATVVSGGAEPLWRQALGKLGNFWIQLWAVPGIWDTQRGFKVFTARAAQEIFPRLTIFGWGFDVEVLAVAQIKKFRIKEIPIAWKHDPDSKINIWAYPQVLLQTLRVFWNKMTGVYGK